MGFMRLRNIVVLLAILSLFSAPSRAGSFGVFGSYWDSKDAGNSWGAGALAGFNITKRLGLQFQGTYYPDFKNDSFAGRSLDLTAIPVDGGLNFNFLPDKPLNIFAGAGVTYYFLSISPGSVDDKTGVYLDGGLDFGHKDSARFFAQVMWRKVDTSVAFGSFNRNLKFDGLSLNAGATWRWGK
jgi:outer membrane protein with beta-barrel domain